jgi:hypothetical protein
MEPPWQCCRGGSVVSCVSKTLRTEIFFKIFSWNGGFSLTYACFVMNSGIRVRESIGFSGFHRRCAGTINRRTVDGPRPWEAEQEARKHNDMCQAGACISRIANETNPPMPARHATQTAASSKAHDNDGTFSKEFNR